MAEIDISNTPEELEPSVVQTAVRNPADIPYRMRPSSAPDPTAPPSPKKKKVGRPRTPDALLTKPRREPITESWAKAFEALSPEEQSRINAEVSEVWMLDRMMAACVKGLKDKLPSPDEIMEAGVLPLPDLAFAEICDYVYTKNHPLVKWYVNDLEMKMGPDMIRTIVRAEDFDDETFAKYGKTTRLVVVHYNGFIDVLTPWIFKFQNEVEPEISVRVVAEYQRIKETEADYWQNIAYRTIGRPYDPSVSGPARDPSTGIDNFDNHNISADEKMADELERSIAANRVKEQKAYIEWLQQPRFF